MVSGEFSRDLRNHIANKDIAQVDLVDRDSGKAKYFPSKNLLRAEFEKIEELVWIARKEAATNIWLG